MFSNLSRSCVRGRTSEHGMRRRIMLKSPCSKHLTRVLQTTPVRPRTTPILADSSEESLTLQEWSADAQEWSVGHGRINITCGVFRSSVVLPRTQNDTDQKAYSNGSRTID
ncbi:hypothetical protein Hanom_Chr12g01081381 [Helianthus anomalus]